jgi:tRNA-dependent cyclodipeptide synthase
MLEVKAKPQEPIGRAAIANPGSRNCSIGISLGKTYFSKDNLEALMRFSLDHFDRTQVLIADWPERWNYMASKGLSMEEATERAMQHGILEANKARRVVNRLGNDKLDTSRIDIVDFQTAIGDNPGYHDVLSAIHNEYDSNSEVRDTFRRWAMLGVGKRIKETGKTGKKFEQALRTATNYTIEEAALMICQADQNPLRYIDVYPASFDSDIYSFLRGLNEGKFPELREEIEMQSPYVHIDTRVQIPLSKRLGEWAGNKIGKSPEGRRNARKRSEQWISTAQHYASIAACMGAVLAGPTAFLLADNVWTVNKRETREFEGKEYILTYRTSGRIEVSPRNNRNVTWFDSNGDRESIEHGTHYTAIYPAPLDSQKFTESSSRIYRGLMAQDNSDLHCNAPTTQVTA